MSKRILVVLSVIASLAASNAFASRARVLVMGTGDAGTMLGTTGNFGSFYTDDAYNIFYNPSYVNDYKNWGIIEKSNSVANPATAATTPGAEGGFVASIANFNVGAYMDRPAVGGVYAGNAPTRPIDLFLGSDMGVKWGVGFSYASNAFSQADNSTNTDWTLHAGVQIADFEPFLSYEHGSDYTNYAANGNNSAATKNWMAGLRYHWGEWVPYAAWANSKYNTGATGATDLTLASNWGFGLGRNTKIAEGARMAYAIGFWRQNTNNGTVANGRNILPIDFAVEGDAMSWLTLRAGLSYRLWDKTNGVSNGDTTTGRVGATVHAGKADFDFAVGKAIATSGYTENPVGPATGSNVDSQYFDIGPGLFTAASLAYHW